MFPIFSFLIIISPFLLIRIGSIRSERIGHLALDLETYFCEIDLGFNKPNIRYVDLFFINGKISNFQFIKMLKRKIIILPLTLLKPIHILNNYFNLKKFNPLLLNYDFYNTKNLLDNSKQHLFFTDDEEIRGYNELDRLGINTNKFVCFLIRDDAYLHSQLGGNWDYHNYRDSSIDNYLYSMENLTKLGYIVIRMGVIVNKKLQTNNPKILDYAGRSLRSDFMDIFLASKCTFCVTTGAGWDILPSWVFKKPMIYSNFVPIGAAPFNSINFLITTKKHYSLSKKKELTFKEVFESGAAYCGSSQCFFDLGIELIDNNSNEINEVVLEMHQKLEGTWNYSKEIIFNYTSLISNFPNRNLDHKIEFGQMKSKFSSTFLKLNNYLIN
jgi:putative glycosyltransferase (TIGR04372 family)